MPKPTAESRGSDIAQLSLELKKLNDESKQQGMERLSKSSNASDREMAENWKKNLANDTSTMIQTTEGSGRRIGPNGRPIGAELKKLGPGEYQTEKKAKGGSIRGCGCETKGKTKGRFV